MKYLDLFVFSILPISVLWFIQFYTEGVGFWGVGVINHILHQPNLQSLTVPSPILLIDISCVFVWICVSVLLYLYLCVIDHILHQPNLHSLTVPSPIVLIDIFCVWPQWFKQMKPRKICVTSGYQKRDICLGYNESLCRYMVLDSERIWITL